MAMLAAAMGSVAFVLAYNFDSIGKKVLTLPIVCQPREVSRDRTELTTKLNEYIATQKGSITLSLYEFDTKVSVEINADKSFVAASTAKVPILLTLYKKIEQGDITKSQMLTVTAADKATGTGYFISLSNGSKKSVIQTAEAMIKASDNTATNMIIRRLGDGNYTNGRKVIQSFADELGATGTNMTTNDITARDLALYFQKLHRYETTTAELSEEMLTLLTQDEKMDDTFKTRLVAGVPEDVRVAHKIGSQTGSITDAGIIYLPRKNYLVVVNVTNGGWLEADAKIAHISKVIYEYQVGRSSAEDEVKC